MNFVKQKFIQVDILVNNIEFTTNKPLLSKSLMPLLLDVEDTTHVTLEYHDFAVQVNLCFMQQHNRRDLYIAGTDGYVEWNAIGNTYKYINYINGNEELLSNPDYTNDEMFISQAGYFLNESEKSDSQSYLKLAKGSLSIVQAAKESMKIGCKVNILNHR